MAAGLPGLWSKPAVFVEKGSISRWQAGENMAIKTRWFCCITRSLLNMSV